jgi:hypothetical protein
VGYKFLPPLPPFPPQSHNNLPLWGGKGEDGKGRASLLYGKGPSPNGREGGKKVYCLMYIRNLKILIKLIFSQGFKK